MILDLSSDVPSSAIDWEIPMPPLDTAERIDPTVLRIVGPPGNQKPFVSRRRVPRVALVHARTWIEARSAAQKYWAERGVTFNPMSIR